MEKYLSDILDTTREVLLDILNTKNVVSIIVFGSAARPKDFIPEVSDVDILILTKETPSRRRYDFTILNTEIHATTYTLEEFKKLVEFGEPLAFMLKYRVVLYGDDIEDLLKELKITSRTKSILRRSIFAALGLSLENYYIYQRS